MPTAHDFTAAIMGGGGLGLALCFWTVDNRWARVAMLAVGLALCAAGVALS